jgi:3-dehydroquinate synthase
LNNIKKIKSYSSNIFISEKTSVIKTFLQNNKYSKIIILVDNNTKRYCLPLIIDEFDEPNNFEIIEIESGEENKNIKTCIQLWSILSQKNADRKSLLINLGGGVIGDIGGFVASTFKRGIHFINIPTTLLAMVDASIGGKTGVDLDNIKNIIGVFKEPQAVFINLNFLKTLPQRQILSGFAEIIKHGLIANKTYWNTITKSSLSDNSQLNILIKESINIKNNIVKKDPFEKDLRKILNFGHTIGHAIETFALNNSNTDYLLHGEAIAIGLICETFLSTKYLEFDTKDLNSIANFIKSKYNYYHINQSNYPKLIEIMIKDKKNHDDKINFTLIKSIGMPEINIYCSISDIYMALDYYKNIYTNNIEY